LVVLIWHKILDVVSSPIRKSKKRRQPKVKLYHFEYVDEFPTALENYKIYVAGENRHLWAAAMICPCGCGAVIELNLLKKVRPCWRIKENPNDLATLIPSVRRITGCRSHFILRNGKIVWCNFDDYE
jgi:hypothetical protein